ncbi:MAG TPA: flavin reductase family protein [Aggregatilineales bacterium]|nr:flavin reductase family protein [Anaerolineales bacterium]HRE46411.1 flavin reductase family protein [Aggregatilineales bacterium]
MIVNPAEIDNTLRYKVLIGSVVPRPIAWVSSMNREGALNLAPFSFFTVASTDPMTLIFCPQFAIKGGRPKDTLLNVQDVPEFVINLTNEDTAEAMNRTATELPRGESEFAWAGVTPLPSQTIRVPRVAEAPIAFECRLQRVVMISDQPGGGAVVFGEVQMIHLRDDLYSANGRIALDLLKPIARLAGASYARVTDTFDLERIPPPLA